MHFLPEEVKASLLRRMGNKQAELNAVQEQVEAHLQEEEQMNNEVMSVISDVTGAIEKINSQILQLQKEHDSMVEKEKREKEIQSAKDKGYNEGFADAEKQLTTDDASLLEEEESVPEYDEEFLAGLQNLTDDELELLIEQNPDIATLINRA